MARKAPRPKPTAEQALRPLASDCPGRGKPLRPDYDNWRTVTTSGQVLRLRLKVRRCHAPACPHFHKPCRPEAEGRIPLPRHESGLDVAALAGAPRCVQHRSVPETHQELVGRGGAVCRRTVTNLLDRHAKKEPKKRVRGVRPTERKVEGRDDPQGRAVRGYRAAVRSAISDDGRPPVGAGGPTPHGRPRSVHASLKRAGKRGGLPRESTRPAAVLGEGLGATAGVWPGIRQGGGWVRQAARILKNEAASPGPAVRRRLGGLPGAIRRHRPAAGKPAAAMGHFLTVTGSYWPGLFRRRDVPGLPRTTDDLEHLFGSDRYHGRRATGRKAASPAMVPRGPVRRRAATTTRLRAFTAESIAAADVQAWRRLRAELDDRREAREPRCRFRRNPVAYLRQLEDQLHQPTLPA